MEVTKQLEFLKDQTQNIDSEILILLKRRLQTQKRIFDAEFKNNMEVSTKENDLDTIDYVTKKAREMEISDSFIHKLYSVILDETEEVKKEFIEKQKNKN